MTRLTAVHGRLAFAAQALAGTIWWFGVALVPAVREATLGSLDAALVAIFDVPLFVVASALAAAGLRWAVWIVVPWTLLVAAGMIAYATVTGEGGWGALAMLASSALALVASPLVLTGRVPVERYFVGPLSLRVADDATTATHGARTAAQIAAFWGLFLVALPALIAAAEQRWHLDLEFAIGVRVVGAMLFAAATAVALWSAWSMVTRGDGTPLPSQSGRRLVVAGPYCWVRNPMAVTGIAQGIAVGLMLGSWLVVVYALAGSLVWHAVVRPVEEADLERRFGAAFERYRAAVPFWVPRRLGPWRDGGAEPDGAPPPSVLARDVSAR